MKKFMKKHRYLLFLAVLMFVLIGCKGSKHIQGTWNVQNSVGESYELKITENKLLETFSNGSKNELSYKQNAVGTKKNLNLNGKSTNVSYHGLTDNHGNKYSLIFPNNKDKTIALFFEVEDFDEPLQGKLLLAMSKESKPDYYEYANKYMTTD